VDATNYVAPNNTPTNTYLIDAARNTDEMYAGLRGDICQYIGKTQPKLEGYRMPTAAELGTFPLTSWESHSGGWTRAGNDWTVDLSLANEAGTTDIIAAGKGYARNTTKGNLRFPASGCREYDGQHKVNRTGDTGLYWSGSAGLLTSNNAIGAYFLDFKTGTIGSDNIAEYRYYGFSVRCIKN
jgi:hypothetical protein